MRNDSADLSNDLKEIRYRLWWALYTLEHQLCSMTGRVNGILDEQCTTPLPVPVVEEEFETRLGMRLLSRGYQQRKRAPSSNVATTRESAPSSRSGPNKQSSRSSSTAQSTWSSDMDWANDVPPNMALYFLHLVQLSRLSQTIIRRLYSPTASQAQWSDIQILIENLNQQLDNWYHGLPAVFDFKRRQTEKHFYEARLALGFFYYNTKQVLYRPCLCPLDRRIPGPSGKSRRFNHAAATTCAVSAQEQLALISDDPNAVGLLRVGPWTSIVHLLVRSATVLMLEISFRAHHIPEQADDLLESAKKTVRWLRVLGNKNLAAARA